jgi:cell division protein FtsB
MECRVKSVGVSIGPVRTSPQLIAVVLVLGLACAMAITPTRELLEQRARIAGMARDLGAIERSNGRLQTQVDRLTDPDYLEEQARSQMGLVRPGETAYMVMPKRQKDRRERTKTAVSRPAAEKSFLERVLHFVGIE